jgi:hypothetical protein
MSQHACRRVSPGVAHLPSRWQMAGGYVAVFIPSVSPVDTHTTSMWYPTRRAAALTTDRNAALTDLHLHISNPPRLQLEMPRLAHSLTQRGYACGHDGCPESDKREYTRSVSGCTCLSILMHMLARFVGRLFTY